MVVTGQRQTRTTMIHLFIHFASFWLNLQQQKSSNSSVSAVSGCQFDKYSRTHLILGVRNTLTFSVCSTSFWSKGTWSWFGGMQCSLELLLSPGRVLVRAHGYGRENDPTAARSTPPRLRMCTRNPRESWLPPLFPGIDAHHLFCWFFVSLFCNRISTMFTYQWPELRSYFQFSWVHSLALSGQLESLWCDANRDIPITGTSSTTWGANL